MYAGITLKTYSSIYVCCCRCRIFSISFISNFNKFKLIIIKFMYMILLITRKTNDAKICSRAYTRECWVCVVDNFTSLKSMIFKTNGIVFCRKSYILNSKFSMRISRSWFKNFNLSEIFPWNSPKLMNTRSACRNCKT